MKFRSVFGLMWSLWNNGNHPDVQAMKNIEEEANQIIENIVKAIESDVEAIENLRDRI